MTTTTKFVNYSEIGFFINYDSYSGGSNIITKDTDIK